MLNSSGIFRCLYLRIPFDETCYFDFLHLYRNICTFYSLCWENMLVAFKDSLIIIDYSRCLKWGYFKYGVVSSNIRVDYT